MDLQGTTADGLAGGALSKGSTSAAPCKFSDSADTPPRLSRRQNVTSRAAVRIDSGATLLWNQGLGEKRTLGACFAEAVGGDTVPTPKLGC